MTDRAPIQTIAGYPIGELIRNVAEVSGESGIATIRKATVTLTDAEIKNLPVLAEESDYGLELIPSPGEGKLLHLLGGLITTNFFANYAGFVDEDYWDIGSLNYIFDLAAAGVAALTHLLASAESGFHYNYFPLQPRERDAAFEDGWGQIPEYGGSARISEPVGLWVYAGNGVAYTGGHPDNTMRITLHYTIEDV